MLLLRQLMTDHPLCAAESRTCIMDTSENSLRQRRTNSLPRLRLGHDVSVRRQIIKRKFLFLIIGIGYS